MVSWNYFQIISHHSHLSCHLYMQLQACKLKLIERNDARANETVIVTLFFQRTLMDMDWSTQLVLMKLTSNDPSEKQSIRGPSIGFLYFAIKLLLANSSGQTAKGRRKYSSLGPEIAAGLVCKGQCTSFSPLRPIQGWHHHRDQIEKTTAAATSPENEAEAKQAKMQRAKRKLTADSRERQSTVPLCRQQLFSQ